PRRGEKSVRIIAFLSSSISQKGRRETVPDSSAEFSGYSTLSIALLLPFDLPACDKFFEVQRHRPMTKAIIFDLDGCLAAADEVGDQLFAPAFAAIRVANDGRAPEEKLRAAFAECWRIAFDAR